MRKLGDVSGEADDGANQEDLKGPQNFRLVDISDIYTIFHLFRCLVSKYGRIKTEEDGRAKTSFASLLLLKCKNLKYLFFQRFYTSSNMEGSQAFEVKCGIILASSLTCEIYCCYEHAFSYAV